MRCKVVKMEPDVASSSADEMFKQNAASDGGPKEKKATIFLDQKCNRRL